MTEEIEVADLNLTDSELVQLLKNHGVSRRTLMKVLGLGSGVAVLGEPAVGDPGKGTRIDETFGAPYAKDDTVPSGIVDHVVELHLHGLGGDGDHKGFPVPDDAEDANPDISGFQPDDDTKDDVPEFHFEPVGLHVKPGDVVEFRNLLAETPKGRPLSVEHTVTAFSEKFKTPFLPLQNRMPEGVPGFTSPVYMGKESWLYKFTTKGVYDVFCFPHITLGMVMRIVVVDEEEDDLNEERFSDYPDLKAPFLANANRVLNDEKLDEPSEIITESDGKVSWGELSLDGPPSLPRPTIESLSVTEVEPTSTGAEFDVSWTVVDPNADLDTVQLTLTGPNDGTEDITSHVVSGGSATGTTQLVATGGDGAGDEYGVTLEVTDAGGLSASKTVKKTESETS